MNTQGIGIGLMISSQIIHQFGGNLIVESKMGSGSKFKFKISISKQ
jgi:C4-dicarboxylate-specific signal transduction histidine kinase